MRSLKNTFKIQDEYYTPRMLIDFLIPFLKKNRYRTILCPFDNQNSNYVKVFKENGFKVIYSHIECECVTIFEGNKQVTTYEKGDFFNKWWLNYDFDIVITNPPFSKKKEVVEILTSHNIDFMLLMNLMSINYQDFSEVLRLSDNKKAINFIIPNKKVSFDGNTSSFSSGYICNCLERNWFVNLPHNNSNKHFDIKN